MTNLLNSDIVGTDITPAHTHMSARRLMSYAASLGATEDVYLNDLREGGITGLPTYVISPEWQVMNGQPYRAVLGADNAQMWRCIHVQQDSTIFKPLRPDTHVVTRGKICALRQTRIGAYIAVRLVTSEKETDEAIAESWFCGIFLGDKIEGPDRSIAEPPAPAALVEDFTTGSAPMLEITRALPHLYTEAADIWNPIHTERTAARDAGLDDTLLHGSCSWGAAGLQIVRQFGQGDPARLTRLGARMTGKALVGASLFMRHRSVDAADGSRQISFEVIDDNGQIILANGHAEIAA
ncbi:MaoC/PaaZ C-terminal domain-containing protein [Sulfitobacter sp. F26169L]|uniref:MaoC/PaaZ C-terminal domain-containing protein n=1 Tax=Sulfitobacter sp. F26169L TaxID=2996015 RepID=UPI00226086D6|nr:MaoC/PaaZ C-terminal domain-containing protein [Sulfitobacter sp. F26169L]MCX7567964.1 MaoC/PaaZ C-terminal domain-containing protein [Sulfitobacter sp. F26169L]